MHKNVNDHVKSSIKDHTNQQYNNRFRAMRALLPAKGKLSDSVEVKWS